MRGSFRIPTWATLPRHQAPFLVEYDCDGHIVQEYSLAGLPCYLVGRSFETCELHLDNPSISRQHAALIHDGDNLIVVDLSVNGTILGEEKLERNQLTVWNDARLLRFGNCPRIFGIAATCRDPKHVTILAQKNRHKSTENAKENEVSPIVGGKRSKESGGPKDTASNNKDSNSNINSNVEHNRKREIHEACIPEESSEVLTTASTATTAPAAAATHDLHARSSSKAPLSPTIGTLTNDRIITTPQPTTSVAAKPEKNTTTPQVSAFRIETTTPQISTVKIQMTTPQISTVKNEMTTPQPPTVKIQTTPQISTAKTPQVSTISTPQISTAKLETATPQVPTSSKIAMTPQILSAATPTPIALDQTSPGVGRRNRSMSENSQVEDQQGLGVVLQWQWGCGHRVCMLNQGGVAERTKRISIGDILVKVNETPVGEVSPSELSLLLDSAAHPLGCSVCLAFKRVTNDAICQLSVVKRVNLVPYSVHVETGKFDGEALRAWLLDVLMGEEDAEQILNQKLKDILVMGRRSWFDEDQCARAVHFMVEYSRKELLAALPSDTKELWLSCLRALPPADAMAYPKLKEGPLSKKGKMMGLWHKRFYQVRYTSLFYYKKEKDRRDAETPHGVNVIDLADVGTVRICEPGEHHRAFCFEIATCYRKHCFHAEGQEDLQQWTAAIARCSRQVQEIRNAIRHGKFSQQEKLLQWNSLQSEEQGEAINANSATGGNSDSGEGEYSHKSNKEIDGSDESEGQDKDLEEDGERSEEKTAAHFVRQLALTPSGKEYNKLLHTMQQGQQDWITEFHERGGTANIIKDIKASQNDLEKKEAAIGCLLQIFNSTDVPLGDETKKEALEQIVENLDAETVQLRLLSLQMLASACTQGEGQRDVVTALERFRFLRRRPHKFHVLVGMLREDRDWQVKYEAMHLMNLLVDHAGDDPLPNQRIADRTEVRQPLLRQQITQVMTGIEKVVEENGVGSEMMPHVSPLVSAFETFRTSAAEDADCIRGMDTEADLEKVLTGHLKDTKEEQIFKQVMRHLIDLPDEVRREQLCNFEQSIRLLLPTAPLALATALETSLPHPPAEAAPTAAPTAAIPPPPPPPMAKKIPGPPPPPGQPKSSKPKMKLRTLHWNKIGKNKVEGTLWSEISDLPQLFSLEEIERLFGIMETPKQKGVNVTSAPQKQTLLDLRRAQVIGIMLSRFSELNAEGIAQAIHNLDSMALTLDDLHAIKTFLPTEEEREVLNAFKGNPTSLGQAEQYFLHLLKVPALDRRLEIFYFMVSFMGKFSGLQTAFSNVQTACQEIQQSGDFSWILAAILSVGNTLNKDTFAGNASGFCLRDLTTLHELKANDGSDLVDFIVEIALRTRNSAVTLPTQMSSIAAAICSTFVQMESEISVILGGMSIVREEIAGDKADDRLRSAMAAFMEAHEQSASNLPKQFEECKDVFEKTAKLFGGENELSCDMSPINFFEQIRKFNILLQRAVDKHHRKQREARERVERLERQQLAKAKKQTEKQKSEESKNTVTASVTVKPDESTTQGEEDAKAATMLGLLVKAAVEEDESSRNSMSLSSIEETQGPRSVTKSVSKSRTTTSTTLSKSKTITPKLTRTASTPGLQTSEESKLQQAEGDLIRILMSHSKIAASARLSLGKENAMAASALLSVMNLSTMSADLNSEPRRCPICCKVYASGSLNAEIDAHIDLCLQDTAPCSSNSERSEPQPGEKECDTCGQIFSAGASATIVESHLRCCPFTNAMSQAKSYPGSPSDSVLSRSHSVPTGLSA